MIRCPRCGEPGYVKTGYKLDDKHRSHRRIRKCKNGHAFYTTEQFVAFTVPTLNRIEHDDKVRQSAVGGSNGETEVRPDSL
jgi:transcriptional regulator NrdR family protein